MQEMRKGGIKCRWGRKKKQNKNKMETEKKAANLCV
jgi:hypothetical protein